jgi:hypothetical protein
MNPLNKQLLTINENLYVLKRTFSEDRIKNVDTAKEWLSADHVFKKDGVLYFCELIPECELVEDTETLLVEEPKQETIINQEDGYSIST